MGLRTGIIGFFMILALVAGDAYGGPILCDGELTNKTARATGQLLVAFGFAYSAAGFMEVGEFEHAKELWKFAEPSDRALKAAGLFGYFEKTTVPGKLKKLDNTVRVTDYDQLYSKLIERGVVVPKQVWREVSEKAKKAGLRGLMGV